MWSHRQKNTDTSHTRRRGGVKRESARARERERERERENTQRIEDTHTHKHTIMGERGEGVEIDLFEFAGGLKRAAMEATTLRERAGVVFV